MPIIIDTNCFGNVFSKSSQKHKDFRPVLEWIIYGKGMIIYGGSKYRNELIKSHKYLKLFRILKSSKKIIEGDTQRIDALENIFYTNHPNKLFNDAHLAAIAIVTKCKVICSEDTTSIPYVCDKKLYPKGISPPVYYTSAKNSQLLSEKYVHKDLKPLCKINKEQALILEKLLT